MIKLLAIVVGLAFAFSYLGSASPEQLVGAFLLLAVVAILLVPSLRGAALRFLLPVILVIGLVAYLYQAAGQGWTAATEKVKEFGRVSPSGIGTLFGFGSGAAETMSDYERCATDQIVAAKLESKVGHCGTLKGSERTDCLVTVLMQNDKAAEAMRCQSLRTIGMGERVSGVLTNTFCIARPILPESWKRTLCADKKKEPESVPEEVPVPPTYPACLATVYNRNLGFMRRDCSNHDYSRDPSGWRNCLEMDIRENLAPNGEKWLEHCASGGTGN